MRSYLPIIFCLGALFCLACNKSTKELPNIEALPLSAKVPVAYQGDILYLLQITQSVSQTKDSVSFVIDNNSGGVQPATQLLIPFFKGSGLYFDSLHFYGPYDVPETTPLTQHYIAGISDPDWLLSDSSLHFQTVLLGYDNAAFTLAGFYNSFQNYAALYAGDTLKGYAKVKGYIALDGSMQLVLKYGSDNFNMEAAWDKDFSLTGKFAETGTSAAVLLQQKELMVDSIISIKIDTAGQKLRFITKLNTTIGNQNIDSIFFNLQK